MKCKEVGGWMWQCDCNLHQGWWQSRFKRIQKFDFKKPSPLFWRVFDRISNSLNHSEGSACQSPISTGNPTCICVQIISAANDNDKRLKLFQYLSINVFNYCGPKLLHHFHNADAWLRWIEPPDDSIDPVVLPSVGLRSNSIFSEKRRNEERMTGKGGRFWGEFRSKTQGAVLGRVVERVVLATIHHFQYLPVRGVHQRPCAFCLSTRLWMKELARAQFQLFIACKPERWGVKKRGGWRVSVCERGRVH